MGTFRKRKVDRGSLRVRVYPVLVEAVEAGVAYGWHRAHKHDDHPAEASIKGAIEDAVLSEFCERFDFDDDQA